MYHRLGLGITLAESPAGRRLKGHFGGIHRMRSAVVDGDPHSRDGKLHHGSLGHALPEALFTGGYELGGNRPSPHLIVKDEIIPSVHDGFHIAGHAPVLAGTARLLLVGVIEFRPLGDRLAVGDPRLSGLHLDGVFAFHPLYIDVQMKLSHAFDDRFRGFLIHMGAESRILLRETIQGLGHVDLRFVVLGEDRQRNDRLRDEHRGQAHVETGR